MQAVKFLTRFLFILKVFLCFQVPLYAQITQGYKYTSVINSIKSFPDSNTFTLTINKESNELSQLNTLEKEFNKKPNRKLLLSYLRSLNNGTSLGNQQYNSKVYLHLANLFARLRLYPLVMKCFLKSDLSDNDRYQTGNFIKQTSIEKKSNKNVSEQIPGNDIISEDSIKFDGIMAINDKDSIWLKTDSGYFNHCGKEIASKPEFNYEILNPFNDGKTAVKYALLIQIQQPKSGQRKIFIKVRKVGHTFITLIKYNSDSTYVARTFGFYPKKDHFLSATPIFPSSSSVFKDDQMHDWDEVVGKFISKRRFQKILQLIKQYDYRKYNLNNNNCTDFGLNAAMIGGINILNTYGKWPFGRGNNPACAGQSVLEGKVLNSDKNSTDHIFTYNDLILLNEAKLSSN
jgi:hypothetical protein